MLEFLKHKVAKYLKRVVQPMLLLEGTLSTDEFAAPIISSQSVLFMSLQILRNSS